MDRPTSLPTTRPSDRARFRRRGRPAERWPSRSIDDRREGTGHPRLAEAETKDTPERRHGRPDPRQQRLPAPRAARSTSRHPPRRRRSPRPDVGPGVWVRACRVSIGTERPGAPPPSGSPLTRLPPLQEAARVAVALDRHGDVAGDGDGLPDAPAGKFDLHLGVEVLPGGGATGDLAVGRGPAVGRGGGGAAAEEEEGREPHPHANAVQSASTWQGQELDRVRGE